MQFQMQVLYKMKLVSSKNILNVKITGAFSHSAHTTNIKTVRQYIYIYIYLTRDESLLVYAAR
jgi:hypothetical protein